MKCRRLVMAVIALGGCLPIEREVAAVPAPPPPDVPGAAPGLADLRWPDATARAIVARRPDLAAWLRQVIASAPERPRGHTRPRVGSDDVDLVPALVAGVLAAGDSTGATASELGISRGAVWKLPWLSAQFNLGRALAAEHAELLVAIGGPALAALREALAGPGYVGAAHAIGGFGADGAAVLIACLADPDRQYGAAYGLTHVRPRPEAAIPALEAVVGSAGAPGQGWAAEALRLIGPPARRALPALLAALAAHPSEEVAYPIIRAIGELGVGDASAVPILAAAPAFGDPELRRAVIEALAAVGVRADGAWNVIGAGLADPEGRVRSAAAGAAEKLAPVPDAWIDRCGTLLAAHADELAAGSVCDALAATGPTAVRLLPAVRGLLRSSIPLVASAAVAAMVALDPDATSRVATLLALLEEGHAEEPVLEGLAAQGPAAAPSVPALLQGLRTGSADRDWICRVLERIGPAAANAAPDVVGMLRLEDYRQPARLEQALIAMGPAAIRACIEALEIHTDPHQDWETTRSLCRIFAGLGRPSLQALTGALGDPARQVRAAYALGAIGPDAELAVPTLVGLLDERAADPRRAALAALEGIGPAAAPAVATLVSMLWPRPDPLPQIVLRDGVWVGLPAAPVPDAIEEFDDGTEWSPVLRPRNWREIEDATDVLAALGDAALPSLETARAAAASDEHRGGLDDAIAAVRTRGPADVPTLVSRLWSEDWGIRESARRQLRRLGPRAALAVPSLVERLGAPPAHDEREAILEILTAIGPAASSSVPALLALVERDRRLKGDVVRALAAVGPAAAPALPLLRRARHRGSGEGWFFLVDDAIGRIQR